jgi:feruloyl esterase
MEVPPPAVLAACFVCLSLAVSQAAFAQQPCEALKSLKLPNVTFEVAEAAAPGWEMPAQTGFVSAEAQKIPVGFCRVVGFATPTGDSHIGFEVWLPLAQAWNGKFLAVGNPGFIGSIARGALAGNMQQGYATAATDTGHVDERYDWAIGHPEKWADWGYRAVHETAVVTKALIKAYYGRPAQYSYWNSCHNGGNQGLNEAQRYPDDFDGIVAGDPAYYITHLQAGSLYISWAALKDGLDAPGYIPPAKYAVLTKAALDACDGNDGLKDGIITDPPRCKFDPAATLCKGADAADCLTAPQVETARKIYAGAKYKDGKQIFSGMAPGSEANWNLLTEKEPFWVNYDFFKGMVFEDPDWDFRSFDVDRDTRAAEKKVGKYVDGNDPDLRPLKKAGGKLLIYQGWNGTALPSGSIVAYYDDVVKKVGGLKETQEFARLFLNPGSDGCIGFMSGQDYNAFGALQDWVEKGVAPDTINLVMRDGQRNVARTRPVCAYPKVSRYKGSGDPDDAANFTCVDRK